MSERVFVDTNVLVYAWDASEPGKQKQAAGWMRALWESRSGRVSAQVLSEFYSVVTQKLRPQVPTASAREYTRSLAAWSPVAIDMSIMELAWEAQEHAHLSWWDALIVAAARAAECRYVLSEDLPVGQDLDGVTVLNPFETRPQDVLG